MRICDFCLQRLRSFRPIQFFSLVKTRFVSSEKKTYGEIPDSGMLRLQHIASSVISGNNSDQQISAIRSAVIATNKRWRKGSYGHKIICMLAKEILAYNECNCAFKILTGDRIRKAHSMKVIMSRWYNTEIKRRSRISELEICSSKVVNSYLSVYLAF